MTISTPASPTWREFPLCLALLLLSGCTKAELPELLISAEQITAATDALFYDDRIAVDIDDDGSYASVIHYSYSKLGPASTCDGLDACMPESKPIITFYIDFPEGRSQVNFICDAIGLYAKKPTTAATCSAAQKRGCIGMAANTARKPRWTDRANSPRQFPAPLLTQR